jgi:hypothetical protein
VAAQQADDARLHGQFDGFDVRLVDHHFKAMGQVEIQVGQRVLEGMAPRDGDGGHGDDDRIGRRLRDVDVAPAGVGEALAVRGDVAVPFVQRQGRLRRGCGPTRLGGGCLVGGRFTHGGQARRRGIDWSRPHHPWAHQHQDAEQQGRSLRHDCEPPCWRPDTRSQDIIDNPKFHRPCAATPLA